MSTVIVYGSRLLCLDAAKGIGIICVVIGHIATDPLLARFIFSFHMPLFFFLSGIAFEFSRQEQFICRHMRSLLMPYVIFCILSFLYWFLLERHFRPSDFNATSAFLNIFFAQGGKYIFNSVMWFLPCLFIVEVFYYTIQKRIPSGLAAALVVLAFVVAGFAVSGTKPFPPCFRLSVRLPLMLDTAMVGLAFYALGACLGRFPATGVHLCKSALAATMEVRRTVLASVSISAFALCLSLAVFFPSKTDLAEFILSDPVIFFIGSCSGIVAVIAAAKCVSLTWLQATGRMSLVIMCLHEPVKRVLLKIAEGVLGIDIADLRVGIFTSIVIATITLFFCISLALFIYRFFPWIAGKKARG
jgi:fucose 4-O-acetylase-like acetyltransferase